ncbi:MAG: hypothetical protein U9Q70_11055 [Chloroflexota bacterium]|nr:hypothetical protein [Chloroflexota bacterium]
MQRSKSTQSTLAILVILLALLLSGCLVTKDSPAPGCIKSIGLPIIGGCFGKTVILDLMIKPPHECLDLTANNCNGGVLEVNNTCHETLALDGVEIPPSSRVSLDVSVGKNGTYSLNEVSSNFSDYIPTENESITITGRLGSQDVTVIFTKTAQLCE